MVLDQIRIQQVVEEVLLVQAEMLVEMVEMVEME